MKVKTFRGRSVQQAISKIKAEIGPDAIIMSTKRVPKNRANPYGEQVFEVIASLPDPEPVEEEVFETLRPMAEKRRPEIQEKKVSNKYIDLDETETVTKHKDYSSDEIFKELSVIKDMLFKFPGNEGFPEEVLNFPGVSSVYSMLIENGVSQGLARKIIMTAYAKEKDGNASIESFRKTVFMEMISKIEVIDPFESTDKTTIAAAFIGPTGVGKTTTIAKIAAELTLNEGKKVGLVSVDNYRVGALKQLETYAAILGIPCMPAFEKDELEKAVSRMRTKDVVLIDTAGISSFDEEKLTELKNIFETSMPVSTHLVLSLTSSLDNLRESSKNFAELNPSSYVFTKLDEIGKKGALLDQLDFMNLPVSFLANGQKVPEDIERAGKKTILKKIFTDK